MEGILLSKEKGAVKVSIIRLNYIFTISKAMILKTLFHLSSAKKQMIYQELLNQLNQLKE